MTGLAAVRPGESPGLSAFTGATDGTGATRAEFEAWFRLLEIPGLGRESARHVLRVCGSPEAVFSATREGLTEVLGARAAALLTGDEPPHFQARLAAALDWLEGAPDRHVLTIGDALYPPALLQSADPPLLIYVQGDPAWLHRPSVAIVGSRQHTPQGREDAFAFARALSGAGQTIVSGLALGIDGAAHEGGLEGIGSTVAVVGTGLDRVYPARHRALAHRIREAGAIVSEFAPGTPPLAENFPQRNRIIAGLSSATLVVEAALRSGSLITARLAMESGRDVFAIPGSIHSPQSKGCHALIKQGAKLVESAEDVLEDLTMSPVPTAPRHPQAAAILRETTPADDAPSDPLLDALGHDPATLDALMARTGRTAADLMSALMELELEGRVTRSPGGLYQRLFAA